MCSKNGYETDEMKTISDSQRTKNIPEKDVGVRFYQLAQTNGVEGESIFVNVH